MKSLLTIALFLLPMVARAEVTSETFCFSSGSEHPINFEMRTYYDSTIKFSSAFVKYQNAKRPIPLVLDNSTSETPSEDASDQETTTWIEVFNGQATGEYEMITQGTQVSSMVYTSKKKNKKTGFVLNTSAMAEGDCKW
ncbi:hypothetical protein E2553_07775 [Paraburkholderia dipogonis]|uniref:Adhesin n=1 Tax=Paraburkholderia dipogonis TaxID=1211383 RepID=A0A4Y8N5Q5_9BURK|nr:hypothetical protein [Paraburkholderia dipogonis]TFE44923.1 hypothetical protein E2553_07775 [Paraburkholderia dipogonis]